MGKIVSTSRKDLAICGAIGFSGATLLMLILTTVEGMTSTETPPYFFVSWVLFSAIAWVGWKW